tara:strand:+ start:9352 stop:9687 length:336 start_codon:yes stop_codon:yes gene_type:complete
MNKLLAVILMVVLSTSVFALDSSSGKIDRMISYSKFGNGDVFVSLSNNGAICTYGYFINKDSAGYQSSLSLLVAAYHSNIDVKIMAYDSVKWSGNTANTVCEIYSVEYVRP